MFIVWICRWGSLGLSDPWLLCVYLACLTLGPAWIGWKHCSYWLGFNALTPSAAIHSCTQLTILHLTRCAYSLSRQLLCAIHSGKPVVCCFSSAIASMRCFLPKCPRAFGCRRVSIRRSEGLPLPGHCKHNITFPSPLALSSQGSRNLRNCCLRCSFSYLKFPLPPLQNSPGTHQTRELLGKWNWKCPLRLSFSHS